METGQLYICKLEAGFLMIVRLICDYITVMIVHLTVSTAKYFTMLLLDLFRQSVKLSNHYRKDGTTT